MIARVDDSVDYNFDLGRRSDVILFRDQQARLIDTRAGANKKIICNIHYSCKVEDTFAQSIHSIPSCYTTC